MAISPISLGSIVMPAAAPVRMNASAGSPRARKARSMSARARSPRDGARREVGKVLVEHRCIPGSQLGLFGDQEAVEVIDPPKGRIPLHPLRGR